MSITESSRRSGIILALLVVISAFTPFLSSASATGPIELSLSNQHLLISPGTTANITLTIHNNDSQINDYTVEVNPNYHSAWNISIVDSIIEDVLPTFSSSTTIVVTLDSLALLSDQTLVEFVVNQSGSSETSSIDVILSVEPHYEASIDVSNVGVGGLLLVNPGSTLDVDIDVMNLGNMNDTILLDIVDEPDLVQWWDDYNSAQSEPVVNGNETITLVEPVMGSEYDISQEDVEIVVNASGLTPNLEYDFYLNAFDENGTVINWWISTFNSTNGLATYSSTWQGNQLQPAENITLVSNISFNGTDLGSDFSTICLYDTYGCSVIAQYELTEGTITGSGNLSYAYDSNGTTYVPGTLVDDGTLIEITATADANWSFIEFTGDSNSTSSPLVIEIDSDKTIGALFEENQIVVLTPEVVVNVITNATHMFSTFELTNLTQGDDYEILFEINTNDTIPIPVDLGWDNFTASNDNLSRYYNATYANDSYCIYVTLSKNFLVLDTDSICFEIPSSSTSMSINMVKSTANLPTGWAVYWIDDVYTNMSPMSSDNAVLRIVIPNGTSPGYHGIRLWASSTQGNVSMSTVIVIQIGTQDSVGISDITNHTWLPDQSAEVSLEITNTGNRAVGYDYSTNSQLGPCDIAVSSVGSTLEVDETELALVSVRPWEVAHRNDTCEFDFVATNRLNGEETTFHVQIRIGVNWGLEIYSPASEMLGSDETKTVTFTVKNLGTEQDEYRVEVVTPSGLTATPPPGWLTISREQTSTIDIDFTLDSDSNLSGINQVTIKLIGLNGAEAQVNYDLNIEGLSAFDLVGPQDSRLQINAGTSAELLIDVINTGTQVNDYDLQVVSGLPSCLSLNGTDSDLTEAEPNSVRELSISFEADSNCQSGDYSVTIIVEELNSEIIEEINIIIQLSSLGSVDVSASSTSPVVDDNAFEQLILTVTNLGSDSSTFEVTVSGASGFDISLDTSILSLNPGEQVDINLGIKRTTALGTVDVEINVKDTSKPSVTDSIIITALEPINMAELIIQASNSVLVPGEILSGNLLVSNQGNQNDNFSISSNGISCVIQSSAEIDAQESVTLPFSCGIPSSTDVGTYILTFTAISSNDITKQISETLQYQISSDYNSGSNVVAVSISETSLSMNYDGSGVVTVTVINLLNEQVSGKLSVEGSHVGSFEFTWDGFIDDAEYELGPDSQMSIKLTITPKTNAAISTDFQIIALSQTTLASKSDSSEILTVNVDGLRLPPNGLDLKFRELDAKQTMIGLFSGWGIVLLVILMRIRRFKNRNKNSVEMELPVLLDLPPMGDLPPIEEPPIPELKLPELPAIEESISIETTTNKLGSDGTVRCPGCQAKLRPPSGKSPPFRFSCPKCTEMVRVS
mgnify:CR=1 FL=1